MSLLTILQESKSKLTALLSFANETTGQADTNIGDAIRTLCDGYGGGINKITGEIIGDGVAHFNDNSLLFNVEFQPTFFAIWLDASGALDQNHFACAVLTPDVGFAANRAANSTAITNGGIFCKTLGVDYTKFINFIYENGVLKISCAPASRVLYNNARYKYIIM